MCIFSSLPFRQLTFLSFAADARAIAIAVAVADAGFQISAGVTWQGLIALKL